MTTTADLKHRLLEGGIALCLIALAAAVYALGQGSAFVATWFYVLAWYPVLLSMDLLLARAGGDALLSRPGTILGLLWWSAVIWLVFEVLNFPLKNWYYVNLEPHRALRWLGTVLAFATVLPAIFLPERLLARMGVGARWRGLAVTVSDRHRRIAFWAGWGILGTVLLFPRYFFPLVWGALWLIAEPGLWTSRPDVSLWRDMAAGRWGRIARLLMAGLVAGVIWESLNIGARAKWIYTVPFLEEVKLFEMPILGFLGFPFFALEAWSLYHLITNRPHRVTRAVGSVIFMIVALMGMERWSISSTAPALADLAATMSAGVVKTMRDAGYEDVWELAHADSLSLVRRTGLSPRDVSAAQAWARLVTLRGIGSSHAARLASVGVRDVTALAQSDPRDLAARLADGRRPTAGEVRVWVRAARRAQDRN